MKDSNDLFCPNIGKKVEFNEEGITDADREIAEEVLECIAMCLTHISLDLETGRSRTVFEEQAKEYLAAMFRDNRKTLLKGMGDTHGDALELARRHLGMGVLADPHSLAHTTPAMLARLIETLRNKSDEDEVWDFKPGDKVSFKPGRSTSPESVLEVTHVLDNGLEVWFLWPDGCRGWTLVENLRPAEIPKSNVSREAVKGSGVPLPPPISEECFDYKPGDLAFAAARKVTVVGIILRSGVPIVEYKDEDGLTGFARAEFISPIRK